MLLTFSIVSVLWTTGVFSLLAGAALRGWIGVSFDKKELGTDYLNGMPAIVLLFPFFLIFGLYVWIDDMRRTWR